MFDVYHYKYKNNIITLIKNYTYQQTKKKLTDKNCGP